MTPGQLSLYGEENMNVLDAAKLRVKYTFDNFEEIFIAFSGGKDSTVLLHLVMEEAKKRNVKVGVLFIDWEAQFSLTIQHIKECLSMYADWIIPFWICLPLLTTNSCSMFEPEWVCWDSSKKDIWVREIEKNAISDGDKLPFYYPKMTFEEFVPKFGMWYGKGKSCACLVGIRAEESLNRLRSILSQNKTRFNNLAWTTCIGEKTYNLYPIYDWKTSDIWIFHGKYPQYPHNPVYELMYKAGVKFPQMRICEPFSEQSRRGLWLYHILEPQTWGRVANRVSGANSASLYCNDRGNILGNGKITKPERFSWKEYLEFLLNSMPKNTASQYRSKIFVYLKWCKEHDIEVPDVAENDLGGKDVPSFRRFVKCVLKGDYWCTMLSFAPQKTSNLEKYQKLIQKKMGLNPEVKI